MITRVSTGKINHRDFRVDQSCPAWLTEAVAGTGSIAYGATGATLAAEGDSSGAMLVTTDALDRTDLSNVVLRAKTQKTTTTNSRYIVASGVHDVAAQPAAAATTNYLNPAFYFYRTAGAVEQVLMHWWATLLDTYTPAAATTFYLFDTLWDATTTYLRVRSATDRSLLDSASSLYAYTNDPWWYVGDPRSAPGSGIRATLLVEYVQMMTSYSITVTGLSGHTVELYDISGTLIDSAAEAGGTATIDAATCDFNSNPDKSAGGFRGTLKVLLGGTVVEELTLYDIWGGDAFEYEYTAPPVTVSYEKGEGPGTVQTIEIWDKDETERLSLLTPDAEKPENAYSELEHKSNEWGYLSCTFKLIRETSDYWEDLEDSNVVKVLKGNTVVWEGDIESVERLVTDQKSYTVQCVGGSSKLKNMGSDYNGADLDPAEKASTYIVAHILTDSDLGLVAGNIDTNDYAITTGLEFFPGKAYEEMFNRFFEYNDYRGSVFEDGKLNYEPRKTSPTYYVRMNDCEETKLNRTRSEIKNWIQVAFTPDGSVYDYIVDFDQDSIDAHGKRCLYLSIYGTQAEAENVASVALAALSKLKPSSALTTDIVRDQYGALLDPDECRSLEVLHVEQLLTTEETIASAQAINESNTWEVIECAHKDGRVTFSPGAEENTLSVLLKQLEDQWAVFG
jgi:hypothetical protein